MIRDQANLRPIQASPEMHTALQKRNWVVSNSCDAGGANINRTSESAWNLGEMMESFPDRPKQMTILRQKQQLASL